MEEMKGRVPEGGQISGELPSADPSSRVIHPMAHSPFSQQTHIRVLWAELCPTRLPHS